MCTHIRYAIVAQRICWKAGPISERFKSFLVTVAFPRPRGIHIFRLTSLFAFTTTLTRWLAPDRSETSLKVIEFSTICVHHW